MVRRLKRTFHQHRGFLGIKGYSYRRKQSHENHYIHHKRFFGEQAAPQEPDSFSEGLVEFAEALNDAGYSIWLAESGLSAFDENDPRQSYAAGDSASMKAPKTPAPMSFLLPRRMIRLRLTANRR